ncbi:hypothetical protein ACH4Y0_03030 [Streptomyces sp. NPDC020707]|uniref:hypothetical protein n=1 Tax=Streptomyces sp. NPDC020707 TaxID=3365084 RepID=UPI0037A5D7EB
MPAFAPSSPVSLFADELLTNPYPVYGTLRSTGAAVHLEEYDVWVIPRHADLAAILKAPNIFGSEDGRAFTALANQEILAGTVHASDGSAHTRLRRVLSKQLAPRAMTALASRIAARAERLVRRRPPPVRWDPARRAPGPSRPVRPGGPLLPPHPRRRSDTRPQQPPARLRQRANRRRAHPPNVLLQRQHAGDQPAGTCDVTLATLTRTAPGPPPRPAEAAPPQQVGPGWEVLLMPAPLGRLVTDALAERSARAAPLGWVFAHTGHWGIFPPERSDDLAWPPGTTYLKAGASITLPPPGAQPDRQSSASGWVRRDGGFLTRPLLVHPVLTALAAEQRQGNDVARLATFVIAIAVIITAAQLRTPL